MDQFGVARIDARLKQLGLELVAPTRKRTDVEVLLEITMLRSAREGLLATPVPQERVGPDDAIRYLQSVGLLWRSTDDIGRRQLAVATFTRLGVRSTERRGSHTIVSIEATIDAERHGLSIVLALDKSSDALHVRSA